MDTEINEDGSAPVPRRTGQAFEAEATDPVHVVIVLARSSAFKWRNSRSNAF